MTNRERDTEATQKVLIGSEFAYYGKSAPMIPHELGFVVKNGPGHKCQFAYDDRMAVEAWIETLPERRYVNEPGRW